MAITMDGLACWILVGLLAGLLSGVLPRLIGVCEDLFPKLWA
jgi:hypothetical protein